MTAPQNDPPVLRFGPFRLDAANARLLRDGRALELVPKDLDVLAFFVRHPGRLITKDELLDAVWERRFVSESVLKNAISRLRSLLGDDARTPRYIETAQRRGYRFIAEVEGLVDEAAAAGNGPVSATQVSTRALVGRDESLRWLHQRLQVVLDGRTRMALLAGEAGIGKSSLISAFTAPLASGYWVATGQCIEHAGAIEPYLPMLEAVSGLCKAQPQADMVAVLRQVAPTWLLQLPWFVTPEDRHQLQHEVAGATRERMLREFAELLERISAMRPLVLVIEDLHWSDPATLQLLSYLVRRPGTSRVLLLGSLRPAELIAAEHPLKALRQELRQQRLCDELDLTLFSERDAAAYLARHAGGVEWSDDIARALHEHTGGLPLFIAALIEELAGDLLPGGNGAIAGQSSLRLQERLKELRKVPRSIFGLIEQQHARLSLHSRQRLEAAAVAGVEFASAPIADALGVERDEVQSDFDALVRSGSWLRESTSAETVDGGIGPRYVFRHAVYRHVVYDLIGTARRMHLHRRLAFALQDAHADDIDSVAAELALHFEKGQEPAQAVRYLALAASRALHRFAAAEAAGMARHGLEVLDSLPVRTRSRDVQIELNVQLGLSMAILKGVASEESTSTFGHAAELMDGLHESPARVAALHGIWMAMLARAKYDRAHDMAARALALAALRDDSQLAFAGHSAMGITLVHTGKSSLANEHLVLALNAINERRFALSDALFGFHPEVQLRCYSALALWNLGQPSAAAEHVREAVALADRLRNPVTWILVRFIQGLFECMRGEYRQARDLTEHALREVREQHLDRGAGALWWVNGRAIAALGDSSTGLLRMRQGHELKQRHKQLYGLTRWHEHYAEACVEAGLIDEATKAVDDGLRLAEQTGEHLSTSSLLRVRGHLLRVAGLVEPADAAYRAAKDAAREQGALYLEIAAVGARVELACAGHSPNTEIQTELQRLLSHWSDPSEPLHVVSAKASLSRGKA